MSETVSPPGAQAIKVRHVSKWFGGVRALHNVSLDLEPGIVTCLVGDNGAGKSTLVKMIAGTNTPDSGQIFLGDEEIQQFSPKHARDLGIATVYQNLELCDNLDTIANVTLGVEPTHGKGPFAVLDGKSAREKTEKLLEDVGSLIQDLTTPVEKLSGGQRQAIAIARALSTARTLIILDEPTAALGVKQTKATLELVRKVASLGLPVVHISHSLDDVFEVADRIIALRLGEISLNKAKADTSRLEVVACMTGLEFERTETAKAQK